MTPDQTKQVRRQARSKLTFAEDNWSTDLVKELRQSAHQAQQLYRDLGDKNGELDASRALVHVEYVEKGYEAARNMATELMEHFRRATEKRGEALMRLALAEIDLRESRAKEALREAMEARDIFKQLGLT